MPLQQRLIEPVHVCRNTLPLDDNGVLSVDVPNELECVTNGTLANIIRQLSSLSKQAEDIFGSLVRESTSIAARTNSLQGRVDRLAIKVTQLDSNVEEVSLQDIHMRKAFKSSVVYDQQVVSRESIPAAIKEIYLMCDKPPPLDKLNPYREDGKDGLKFYTDANYFFDLWKQEMLKDTERLAHDKGRKLAHIKEGTEPNQPRQERKRHKKVRQPHNTREKYRMMATKDEFLDKTANYSTHLPYGMNHRSSSHAGDAVDNHSANGYPVRPSSLELQSAYGSGQESGYLSSPTHHYPPPPPAYIEHPQSPTHGYPPPPYAVATPEQGGGSSIGTPTRQLSRVATMVRPTQPPPAPPISSNSSSGTSTPTISATGTPSSGAGRYYKGSSHSRDNLPPPPPPPEGTLVNGGIGQSHFVHNNDVTQKPNRGPNGSIPHTPTHVVQQGGSRHGTPTHHAMTNHGASILIQHNNNNNINNNNNNRDQTPPPVNVIVNQTHPTPESLDLPPPPPTPDKDTALSRPESQLPPSPPPPPPPAILPPPPPPMPLPSQLPNGPVTNGGPSTREGRPNEAASVSSESASTSSSLSKGSENQESKGKGGGTDARSDLLAAIREGIKLRRVEDIKQKEVEKAAPLHDVASILARRIAMEFSDSDSASYSECDSDAWDDETEC